MLSKTLLVDHISPAIVRLTLNRPDSLNAINVGLLTCLRDALRANAKAQVIILEGAGDRSFCSGEDLKQSLAPRTGSVEELQGSLEKLQELTRLTSSSSAIVIAAVQGYAVGGGAELALAADFVIGGPNTRFRFPEATIGHAATGGISLRLVSLVGLLRAKELLLTGRTVNAEESLNIGLLTEIAADPKQRALELANQMAELPVVSTSSSKSSVERAVFPNLEAVLADEICVASHCFAQDAATKAFSDFAQRKKPSQPPIEDLNTALSNAVSKYPGRTFLRFSDGDLSFNEFDERVAKLAGGLKTFGIKPGNKVLVQMRNSIQMVTTWFATNRLGAVWVPINSELKSITLKHVIESAEARLAIVDEEFYNGVEATRIFPPDRVICNADSHPLKLSGLYNRGGPVLEAARVLPSTVSAYLFTSGTTGRSKPCVLTHGYFINQASCLIKGYSITSDDVLYCPFPLFHVDATALTTVPALLTGGIAALSARFSASRFWDEIRTSKATIYDFMGATLALTYKQPPSPLDHDHNVRLAWGVPVPTWAADYEARFGHPIKELYGSVESGLPVIQTGDRVPGSCGKVLPGYTLRIADDNDVPLPANKPGNVLVRTEITNAFFNGYFKAPEKTLAAMSNLWLHTGDVARLDENGNMFFMGRTKDIIRRRGENVNAFEVEEEFLRHADVISVAAFGVPSKLGQGTEEDVKIAVVIREDCGLSEKALWEWSLDHMARFQIPTVIEFVPDLKRTPTGKVEKEDLQREGGVRFDCRPITPK